MALYYQFPGDAIIMSGKFNEIFWHGVPPVNSWETLFKQGNIVRRLPEKELEEANRVIKGEENERHNVTIRWHETHFEGCPYQCNTGPQIAVPQAPAPVPKSAPVTNMPQMAGVKRIRGPVER